MPTQTVLREALVQRFGHHAVVSTTDVATGHDPLKWVHARPSTAGLSSLRRDGADPSSWIGQYLFVRSGAQINAVRRIVNADPETGGLEAGNPFAVAIQSAVEVEVTGMLPAVSYGGTPGWREVLNQALGYLSYRDEVAQTITAGQADYSAPVWMDRPSRFLRVLEPPAANGFPYEERPAAGWHFVEDAEAPKLRTIMPFEEAGGATFTIVGQRPGYSRVRTSGTWGDSLVGLVNESDEVPIETRQVVDAALVFAYCLFAHHETDPQQAAEWKRLYAEQLTVARGLAFWDETGQEMPNTLGDQSALPALLRAA